MKTDKQAVAALDGEAMAIMPSNSSNQEIVAVITDEEEDDEEEEVERMVNALEDESKIENRLRGGGGRLSKLSIRIRFWNVGLFSSTITKSMPWPCFTPP
jgi:hypothetical protein